MGKRLTKLLTDAKNLASNADDELTDFWEHTYKCRLAADDYKKAYKLWKKATDPKKKEKYVKILADLKKKYQTSERLRWNCVKSWRVWWNRFENCRSQLSDLLQDRQINTKWRNAQHTKDGIKAAMELGKLSRKFEKFNQDLMKGIVK